MPTQYPRKLKQVNLTEYGIEVLGAVHPLRVVWGGFQLDDTGKSGESPISFSEVTTLVGNDP